MHETFDPKLLAFDVDGVLLDFYRGAARVAGEHFQRPMVKVSGKPATKHRYGLTEAEYQELRTVMLSHHHGWRNLPPLPGAVEAVQQLKNAGNEVVFLTSCGERMQQSRKENLIELGLSDCPLICVEDGHDNKGRILRKLRPVAFVDDHEKMLIQAPFVPERVFIDHGCDPQEDEQGRPLDRSAFHCVPSLAHWANHWLSQSARPHRAPRAA